MKANPVLALGILPSGAADRPKATTVATEAPENVQRRRELVPRAIGMLASRLNALLGQLQSTLCVMLREPGLNHCLYSHALPWRLAVERATHGPVGVLQEPALGHAIGTDDAAAGEHARLVDELARDDAFQFFEQGLIEVLLGQLLDHRHGEAESLGQVGLVLLPPSPHHAFVLLHQVVVQWEANAGEKRDGLTGDLASW
mmetsp:Transcript_90560/g.230384  ORF Transcript_90560/g.230384 Transcript_90560/m.230384 type:complete len:200 (+) Transcript_90560:337-936(+)